jgi:hypothetical protein
MILVIRGPDRSAHHACVDVSTSGVQGGVREETWP